MKRLVMLTALTLLTSATGCGGVEEADASAESQPMTVTQALYIYWTTVTSEELPPLHCEGKTLAFGATCALSYCDEVRLGCKDPIVSTTPATFGYPTWTPAFSEESSLPTICPNGSWVTGMACTGGYCDTVTLECTPITGRTVGTCAWSPNISDGSSAWRAPEGYYIRGAKCSGWWCDDMSYYYCKMN